MVEISASQVKELRDRSGAAMMDCKKALVEAQGNFDKAFEVLRQRGVAVASKKASRATSEGLVVGKLSADVRYGCIMEVNCETDFVARNPEFVELTEKLVEVVMKTKPSSREALLKEPCGSGSVQDFLTDKVAKTGENMNVRRLDTLQLSSAHGAIGLYIHAVGSKMGVLLELESSREVPVAEISALSRELSMHIVSAKPQYVSREQISQEIIDNERRIESGKADLADKKPEIRDKIISGRVDKLLAERCLLDQPFVKDPSLTIAQYLKEKGKAWSAELKPVRFALYILGETPESQSGKNGTA